MNVVNVGIEPYDEREIYHHRLSVADIEAVPISSTMYLSIEEARSLNEQYNRAGFVVYEHIEEEPSAESVERLAMALDLGAAFVPPMYKGTGASATYTASGINCISAQLNSATQTNHPAFQATNGQALHSDGTLQPIGYVKTSLLLCATPAAEGGESTIFNAVAAFHALSHENPAAAQVLMTDCLRRTQNYGGRNDTHLGPAFTIRGGELLSRYSITSTDSWTIETEDQRTLIDEACRFMDELARPGTGFWLQFQLNSRQGLIMANDKVAHGRRAYRDAPHSIRKMFRGLYLRRLQFAGRLRDTTGSPQ